MKSSALFDLAGRVAVVTGGNGGIGRGIALGLAEAGAAVARAIVATARKLAVLLHHLWVSGEVYEPLHNSSRTTVAAAA